MHLMIDGIAHVPVDAIDCEALVRRALTST